MNCSKSNVEEKNENWPENYQKFQNQKCCSHLQVLFLHYVRHTRLWLCSLCRDAIYVSRAMHDISMTTDNKLMHKIIHSNRKLVWASNCHFERFIERANITAIYLGVVIYVQYVHKSMESVNRTHLKVAVVQCANGMRNITRFLCWSLCCLLFDTIKM